MWTCFDLYSAFSSSFMIFSALVASQFLVLLALCFLKWIFNEIFHIEAKPEKQLKIKAKKKKETNETKTNLNFHRDILKEFCKELYSIYFREFNLFETFLVFPFVSCGKWAGEENQKHELHDDGKEAFENVSLRQVHLTYLSASTQSWNLSQKK